MHALPIKPRLIVVRDQERGSPVEHPPHLVAKPAFKPHPLPASSPRSPSNQIEAHEIDSVLDDSAAVGSHPLPEAELQRNYSVKQHPINITANEEEEEEELGSDAGSKN